MKRDVIISENTYRDHREFLKQVFNEAGFFLKPITDTKGQCNLGVVFSPEDYKLFGLNGTYAKSIGTERFLGKQRFVVFPQLKKEQEINWNKFKDCLQLLSVVDTSKLDVRVVLTEKDRKRALVDIGKISDATVDFETKFIDPYQKGAKLLSVAVGNDKYAWVVPLEHKDSVWLGKLDEQNELLTAIYNIPSLTAHHSKFELRWFHSRGFDWREFDFDTMYVHSLLDETSGHGLDIIAAKYTDYAGYHLKFESTLENKKDYESAPISELLHYNGLDVIITAMATKKMKQELHAIPKLEKYWNERTKLFVPMLANMEDNGFTIDVKELFRLEKWYKKIIVDEEKKLFLHPACIKYFKKQLKETGKDFNFASYPQMRELLYGHLKFKVRHYTWDDKLNKPSENPSVDETALQLMRLDKKHGDILDSLARRTKAATMVKSFLNVYADKIMNSVDGKVRTNYNIHIVETGRLSSSKPNMQNMPTSAALVENDFQPIKTLFVSRFKNGILMSADESQVELRIAGMYSGDSVFCKAFKERRDLHGELAEKVFGSEYTKDQRTKAKRTNFSAIFDVSAKTLSEKLRIPEDEACVLLTEFRQLHPELYAYFDALWESARTQGYVENFSGRRRHIKKELDEANKERDPRRQRGKVEGVKRQVWNFPIQSTAAEITLYSTWLLWREMRRKNMKSLIIGNVHDSLINDMIPAEAKQLTKMVKDIFMKEVLKYLKFINLPLVVDVSVGKNLYNMEEV